jgi:hypothetical protein
MRLGLAFLTGVLGCSSGFGQLPNNWVLSEDAQGALVAVDRCAATLLGDPARAFTELREAGALRGSNGFTKTLGSVMSFPPFYSILRLFVVGMGQDRESMRAMSEGESAAAYADFLLQNSQAFPELAKVWGSTLTDESTSIDVGLIRELGTGALANVAYGAHLSPHAKGQLEALLFETVITSHEAVFDSQRLTSPSLKGDAFDGIRKGLERTKGASTDLAKDAWTWVFAADFATLSGKSAGDSIAEFENLSEALALAEFWARNSQIEAGNFLFRLPSRGESSEFISIPARVHNGPKPKGLADGANPLSVEYFSDLYGKLQKRVATTSGQKPANARESLSALKAAAQMP